MIYFSIVKAASGITPGFLKQQQILRMFLKTPDC